MQTHRLGVRAAAEHAAPCVWQFWCYRCPHVQEAVGHASVASGTTAALFVSVTAALANAEPTAPTAAALSIATAALLTFGPRIAPAARGTSAARTSSFTHSIAEALAIPGARGISADVPSTTVAVAGTTTGQAAGRLGLGDSCDRHIAAAIATATATAVRIHWSRNHQRNESVEERRKQGADALDAAERGRHERNRRGSEVHRRARPRYATICRVPESRQGGCVVLAAGGNGRPVAPRRGVLRLSLSK